MVGSGEAIFSDGDKPDPSPSQQAEGRTVLAGHVDVTSHTAGLRPGEAWGPAPEPRAHHASVGIDLSSWGEPITIGTPLLDALRAPDPRLGTIGRAWPDVPQPAEPIDALRPTGTAEIERRFLYHPPSEATRALHDSVRAFMLAFVLELDMAVPGGTSRERSLMITALEEASFWAHAHIARNL